MKATAHPPVRPEAEESNPTPKTAALRFGNCLCYALSKWFHEGGYIVVRKSKFGWWPHFLWSKDLRTFEQFGPPSPRSRILPPPIFRGRVKTFTSEEGDV